MKLRLLVLELSDRCDQRCVHCAIWTRAEAGAASSLSLEERLRVVDDALEAGAREALLTGGEPLLSPDVWPVAARLRAGGARVMVSTSGLGLARHAVEAARLFDEVYISLDGPDAATHDGARGVVSFERVAAGVAALKQHSPRPRLVFRSVIHARNVDRLAETVASARRQGADHLSFLPLDVSSDAFGGRPDERAHLLPTAEQARQLDTTIERLERERQFEDGFLLEDAAKLRRFARHLEASGGRRSFERPRCDAPRWSSVVTDGGALRPCFFHPAVGDIRTGLATVRSSPAYREAVARAEAPNATCERCVCPKWRGPAWRRLLA